MPPSIKDQARALVNETDCQSALLSIEGYDLSSNSPQHMLEPPVHNVTTFNGQGILATKRSIVSSFFQNVSPLHSVVLLRALTSRRPVVVRFLVLLFSEFLTITKPWLPRPFLSKLADTYICTPFGRALSLHTTLLATMSHRLRTLCTHCLHTTPTTVFSVKRE